MKFMSGLVVRNLSDQLVDLVRDRILNETVPTAGPIRQDALAAELGVSKIPLREALTRLEQEGLLHSRVNHGYFVNPLRASEAEEVFSLRSKLEPALAARAAKRASDEERAYAVQAHDALERATAGRGEGVGALNRAFHIALIRPAGQPITTTLLERLHVVGERYVRKHLEPLGRDQRAHDEHQAILAHWLAGDGKGVASAIQTHIRKTLVDLRRQFAAL